MGKKGGKGPLPHLRSRTTRSSRGRLIPLQPTPSLPDQLRLLGLYAANTLGDGNCLFRALADQVYGSPVRHAEVRREVCDWIEKHGERYEGFVEFEGDDGDDESAGRKGKGGRGKTADTNNGTTTGNSKRLQAYLRNMRENGTYGGHMELSAFAHMMRRNIKVVQPGLVYVIEWRAGEPAAASSGSTSTSGAQQHGTPEKSKSAPSPSASGRRRSMRRDSQDGSKTTVEDPDAGKTKHKVGKGYYVLEEVTSDEDGDDDGVADAQWNKQDGLNQGVPQDESQHREILEDAGPTIYVAYHDWEHFSSIRNLRGPHTGLPNIQETPAPPSAFSEYGSAGSAAPKLSEKEALKEKEREKKRERERKEKEREKERKEKGAGALKVKLRIPPSSKPASRAETPQVSETAAAPPSTSNAGTSTVMPASTPVATSMTTTTSAYSSPGLTSIEPASVPLPTSRSASPFPLPTHLQAELQLGVAGARGASPLRHVESLSASSLQSGYRSPKRSFDESSASASGGEDRDREREEGGSGSGREEKRLRRRMPSGGTMWQEGNMNRSTVVVAAGEEDETLMHVDDDEDVDIDIENVDEDIDVDEDDGREDVELDTPGLSAPGSSSSSSFSSSLSEVSSSPSPEPGVVVDATPVGDTAAAPEESIPLSSLVVATPSKPLKKGTQRYQRQRHLEQGIDGGEQASLTRRQRKALGLPKARKVIAGSATKGMSAGKIIIPGGRWTGRELPKTDAAAAAADADAEEWRRNGTGRLDVRGFRELKI